MPNSTSSELGGPAGGADPKEQTPGEPGGLVEEVDSSALSALDIEELEEAEPDAEPVVYTGTDFDVEGLVRRLERHDIVIPTFGHDDLEIETARFQRSFVWSRPQMDRFIESLLLGYPIPGIMLVQQADRRYLVLDGQQRLMTLQAFYAGIHNGKVFSLSNVAEVFQGLTYQTLTPEQRRTLDNTFIQATIVRTDGSSESLDAVYRVFERLNSGGTLLTAHEIRTALYAGPLISLLAELNAREAWRGLYGKPSPRLRDQELILRIVALYDDDSTYRRPLKQFLNTFVAKHRNLDSLEVTRIVDRFDRACRLLLESVGAAALRRGSSQVNAAFSEAVMVGLMRRLDSVGEPDSEAVANTIAALNADRRLVTSVSRATADEESVRARLGISTEYFSRI